MRSLSRRGPAIAAVLTLTTAFLTFSGATSAADEEPPGKGKHGLADTDEEVYGHQHGGTAGHLDPVTENVQLIGKKKVTNRSDKISDVAVLGDYAYQIGRAHV